MKINELSLHKSSAENLDKFEQQIFNFKNSDKLHLKQLISKLYFEIPNTNIGIPASTFIHDNKKHIITKNDWKRLIKFINQPKLFVEAKRSKAFRGINYLYKYNFDNNYYGVGAVKTKQGWLITTFFKDKESNIDNWLKGNGKAQPEVPTAAYVPGCSLSEGLNNIITHLNKFVNLFEQKVYHGTNKQFKQFDPNFMNRMDYGYGFYFTINKSYAQSYGKYFLTCEIPEDNYLLHWDESYDYQPEHIQNCLDNLCSFFFKKDLDLYNKITDIVYGDLNTGYWIYMKISQLLNLPGKELSELFYNFGIKGIYSFKGDCFVVFNKNDIKILKTDINEETFKMSINKNIMERFEEIESQIFATNSVYDVINILKNKPKSYRVVFDKKLNYYFIGDARNYIHLDLLEAAFRSGFYPEFYSEAEMQDYMDDTLLNEDILLFAFYPTESHAQDIEKSSDGYTRKYVYDFGVIYAHEMTPLEDFDIYKTLGTPIKKQEIFEIINIKKLNEKLEEALGNTVYFGSDHFDPEVIFYSDKPFEMDNTAEINLDDGNLMFLTCNDEDILVISLPYKSIEEIKKEIEDYFDDIKEEAEEYDYVELYDGVFDELGGFEFEADELPDNASVFANLILDDIENSYVDGDSSSASIIFDKDFNILLGKGLSLVKHEEDEEEE